jgi:S-(hydroxymethyl)glutathione dehydrogenase/alcohol dehydrogenase
MESRAVVAREPNAALQLESIEVADPGPGEVLVRIAASGICGSDLHVMHGRSNAVTFPVVLGHEGAGVVQAIGPGVTTVQPGDRVVIALYAPCHECPSCLRGRFVLCTGTARVQAIFGKMADGSTRLRDRAGNPLHPMVGAGTLAEHTVVRAGQLVKVPADVPLDIACLAGCGVTTGLGAVFNIARVAPGDTVAVVGCGGVGLNVVQAARIAGATVIIAVDTNPVKLDLACRVGATHALVPGEGGLVAAIQAVVPGGVDVAFEVVGSPELIASTFEATRAGGTCVMVGSPPPGATIPIDGRQLFNERRLVGCVGGSNVPARDIPRIVDLYRLGRLDLDVLVSARRSLNDFQTAIDETARGDVARSVVVMDPAALAI